jgi:hypothetical protein
MHTCVPLLDHFGAMLRAMHYTRTISAYGVIIPISQVPWRRGNDESHPSKKKPEMVCTRYKPIRIDK